VSTRIPTQIQITFFEDTVSRPRVFLTKSRKFYQRLLDLFIWIHENTRQGIKNFSVLSNLTVVNTIRTSHWKNKKTYLFLLFAGYRRGFFAGYIRGFFQSRRVRRHSSYRFSLRRRWSGECHQKLCFFPEGFTHELRRQARGVVLSLLLLFEIRDTNISVADSVSVIRSGINIINPNLLGPLEVANR
jgi:hypothetical protein